MQVKTDAATTAQPVAPESRAKADPRDSGALRPDGERADGAERRRDVAGNERVGQAVEVDIDVRLRAIVTARGDRAAAPVGDPAALARMLRADPALARIAQANVDPARALRLLAEPGEARVTGSDAQIPRGDARATEVARENQQAAQARRDQLEAAASTTRLTPDQDAARATRRGAWLARSAAIASLGL